MNTLLVLGLLVAGYVHAQDSVSFQALLVDADGVPLSGDFFVAIGIWTDVSGGDRVYGEIHSGVEVIDGVLQLRIGSSEFSTGELTADTFASGPLFLEVTIDDEVLAPRQPFTAVGVALQSRRVGGLAPADIARSAEVLELQQEVQQLKEWLLEVCGGLGFGSGPGTGSWWAPYPACFYASPYFYNYTYYNYYSGSMIYGEPQGGLSLAALGLVTWLAVGRGRRRS